MKKLLIVLLCMITCVSSYAQEGKILPGVKVEPSKAMKLGKVNVRANINKYQSTDAFKKQLVKQQKQRPSNFVGREGGNKVTRPELEHQGPDKVRQASSRLKGVVVEPLVNVEGINIGGSPHDPSGDIGKDHYVQGINVTEIGVFDKEGTLIERFAANVLWQPLGFTSAGDPIILYDQEFDRWYITEFPRGNELLVAVSETSDPLGEYNVYNFSTPRFPDYPKYALWNNTLTVTTNEAGGDELHCYMLDRTALLNGDDQVTMQRVTVEGSNNTEAGFFVATPVDWTGNNKPVDGQGPYFIRLNDSSWGATPQDQIEIYEASIDFTDATNTTITNTGVVISPFDSNPCAATGFGFACIPQPDGNGLDGIPEVIMNQAHYRNFGTHQTMLFNFVTDATDGENLAGIRWVELRKTADTDWSLYQEGTFAPDDGLHRFMGGICMDGNGNIGLAYNVSSETEFAGIRFTGRRANDPLGVMTVDEYELAKGQNTINSGGRFGDYAQMGVDPTNDMTFWFTTEYANEGGSTTRIAAFELTKDTNDIRPLLIVSPQSSTTLAEEDVVVKIQNDGINAQSKFNVGYQFEDGPAIVEEVEFDLQPDSIYTHTFTDRVTFTDKRAYDFVVFTDLDVDDNRGNDTLTSVVTKFASFDLAVVDVINESASLCTSETSVRVVYRNRGFELTDSFTIDLMLNGSIIESRLINKEFALNLGGSEVFDLTGLVSGQNEINATITLSNQADEVEDNNSASLTLQYDDQVQSWTLSLTFDDFPSETSWQLVTIGGVVVATGSDYGDDQEAMTVDFDICPSPDSCYIFTIFDAYGDGLVSFGGNGNYEIKDQFGNVIATLLNANFGSEETNEFCGLTSCALEATVDISAVSVDGANDGVLMVTIGNGAGPFEYSIDGGQTFQAGNTFTDLAAGDYNVVVQGAPGCIFETTASLSVCQLEATLEATAATNTTSEDGSITITSAGANGDLQYSIDGGQTFQSSNTFDGLMTGNYTIVIQDGVNCRIERDVTIDFMTSTSFISLGVKVSISPNPTDGLMNVKIEGLSNGEQKIFADVYDLQGKKVRTLSLYKYADSYLGQGSLTVLPSGTYLVKINHPSTKRLYKIIKQ